MSISYSKTAQIEPIAATVTALLTGLSDAILSASGNWTKTQETTYSTGGGGIARAVVLSHSEGAELCLNAINSTELIHADNCYGGDNTGTALRISFCPSGHTGFATIDGSTNPILTSTFVSAAGAYKFAQFRTCTGAPTFESTLFQIHVIADVSHATLMLIGIPDTTLRPYRLLIACDDDSLAENYSSLATAGDTEASFFGVLDINDPFSGVNGKAIGTTIFAQFFDSVGTLHEDVNISARTNDLTWKTADWLTEAYAADSIVVTGTVAGRKGLLSPNIFHAIREDAMENQLIKISETQYALHIRAGLCVGWQREAGVLR